MVILGYGLYFSSACRRAVLPSRSATRSHSAKRKDFAALRSVLVTRKSVSGVISRISCAVWRGGGGHETERGNETGHSSSPAWLSVFRLLSRGFSHLPPRAHPPGPRLCLFFGFLFPLFYRLVNLQSLPLRRMMDLQGLLI